MTSNKTSVEAINDHEKTRSCKCVGCHCNDQYFDKWLEKASLDGISHVFKGKSKIRRIMWGVIFFGAVVGCLYTVGESLRRFIDKPTATSIFIESTEKSGLSFPAVTICSLDSADKNGGYMAELFEFLFNPDFAFNFGISLDLGHCRDVLKNTTEFERNITIWDGLRESFKDIIHFCGFIQGVDKKVIRCEEELQPVLTSLGICYTFNSITNGRSDVYATATGAKYGLKIIFNVSQNNHPSGEGNSGIKIVVHERDDIPRPNLYGFGIPPGRNAYIGVRKKIDIDHTSNVGCIDDRELSFYPHYEYSQFACRQNSLVEHIAQPYTCDCILDPAARPISGHYGNTPNCTFNDTCCLQNQSFSFDTHSICPIPCHFEYYDSRVSYTSFPTGLFLKRLATSSNKTVKTVQGNLLSVNVFLEDLQVTTTTTEYSYPVYGFLGDIGGNMGLFIGASIISLLEIVVLTLDELKRFCLTKKCKKKLERIDTKLQLPEIIGE